MYLGSGKKKCAEVTARLVSKDEVVMQLKHYKEKSWFRSVLFAVIVSLSEGVWCCFGGFT